MPDNLHAENARLREALKRIIGDHHAPADCYSTGPLTGTPLDDMCPSCAAISALAASASPDPRDAQIAMMRKALKKVENACVRAECAPEDHYSHCLVCEETGEFHETVKHYDDCIVSLARATLSADTGDCGKWSLAWESVSHILELIQEGIISRRKAHESLNAVLHGEAVSLPPLENCAFDDVELPGETVRQLRRSVFELSNDLDMAQGKLDAALDDMAVVTRQRDEFAAALAVALHRMSCPLSNCKECDAFVLYDQPSAILEAALAKASREGAVKVLENGRGLARAIAIRIRGDLKGRRGFKGLLADVPPAIQMDIHRGWVKIIQEAFSQVAAALERGEVEV